MGFQVTEEAYQQIKNIVLDGHSLTIADIVVAARGTQEVSYLLTAEALQTIEASNALKHQFMSKEQPIYGVTTGFGDSCKRQISSVKAPLLQKNLIHFLMNGTGTIAPKDIARATMLIRANCLARGHSAVHPETIRRLLLYLDYDIIPLIPVRGSVGASGDLVPHSYLAAALIGEGEVWYKDEIRSACDVLAEIGLEPLTLEAKEGLALLNGTSFMSAFACLACWDAMELGILADVCTAMASEALRGNRGHFAAFIHEQKPHKGQITSAHLIAQLLQASQLSLDSQQILNREPDRQHRNYQELDHPVQDKYSIRCAPQITGVLYDTLDWVQKWVEIEVNSSNDNPLFDAEQRCVHNGGNFYGGHIVQAMDALKVAVANIADLLDRQLELIVDEKFNNGLSPNLIRPVQESDFEAGLHHGFKGMQLACSAMTAEALKMSGPMSIFSRSTEAHNQDKVSMGSIAAREACAIVELVQNVTAIHLIALCQALELRGSEKMSPRTFTIYELVRSRVPFVERDRRMDRDIEQVVELVRAGAFGVSVRGGGLILR
ncbi:MAG: aromatic amino acid lyase [Chloroflexi bacterium]|nr:MAG: aromatic amino acid lyase [Chloroflexota bacterium]